MVKPKFHLAIGIFFLLCIFCLPRVHDPDIDVSFMKLGGGSLESLCLSVCPSVDARLGKMVQSHNCFPFPPIITKLHIQTSHESRKFPNDFRIKRSKVKVAMHW